MKLLRIVYNKLLPSLFWILLLLALDSPWIAVITLLCAALHEIGHIFVASLVLRRDITMPRAVIYGLRIDTGGIISYKDELLIALGGPFANLLIFFALMPFLSLSEYVTAFAFINLLTAISNLIPLRSYDGQRVILCAISSFATPHLAEAVIHCITLILSATGCFISLFLIGRIGDGYWIFGVFFISFLNEIFANRKNSFTNKKRDFKRF